MFTFFHKFDHKNPLFVSRSLQPGGFCFNLERWRSVSGTWSSRCYRCDPVCVWIKKIKPDAAAVLTHTHTHLLAAMLAARPGCHGNWCWSAEAWASRPGTAGKGVAAYWKTRAEKKKKTDQRFLWENLTCWQNNTKQKQQQNIFLLIQIIVSEMCRWFIQVFCSEASNKMNKLWKSRVLVQTAEGIIL